MTSRASSIGEQEDYVRQYPLNIHLPFERYDHRRLAARDILVHRIISKLLFPGSKILAEAFENHRSKENGLHNFGAIKRCDRGLAKDLELLRKMLVTCSQTETEPSLEPLRLATRCGHGLQKMLLELAQCEDANVRATVGEEILDLVRRHYLENDDPSIRLFLKAIQPSMPSAYKSLPGLTQAKDTHAASVQKRQYIDNANRAYDEKKWYVDDVEHLRSLQKQIRTAQSLDLYDGGALLPSLRQPLLGSRAARAKYMGLKSQEGGAIYREEDWGLLIKDAIYPWPEADAPRRALQIPSGRVWFRDQDFAHPVDFASGRTGRGMDRDGIWSTGRWTEDLGGRGRMARRGRRRAASEPPPDMFTSAGLPLSFHHRREILIFPKMKLATADRRSRRRSLSRTRVAEMFDWNTVLPMQPGKASCVKTFQEKSPLQTERKAVPISNIRRMICVHKPEGRVEVVHQYIPDNADSGCPGMHGISILDDILTIQHKMLPPWPCYGSTDVDTCANCISTKHTTTNCCKPCGFCGAPGPNTAYPFAMNVLLQHNLHTILDEEEDEGHQHGNPHISSNCPVAKHNRCKCGPFPQYHVATKCPVLCSRKCGNENPPGHFKHKNAMTCKARCCMCGIKGHSGQQCKLKRCRCGAAHLGQDCRWKVECRVKGCYRFLCGVHCEDCGLSREDLQEGQGFCRGRCPSCLSGSADATIDVVKVADDDGRGEQEMKTDELLDRKMQQPVAKTGRSRRRNVRKQRDPEGKKRKEELPWYAPLQPRRRPIVNSKSGRQGARKD